MQITNLRYLFLITFKMKQIVLLFFTFSGISGGFTQNPNAIGVPNSLKRTPTPIKSTKNDSLQASEKYFANIFPNPAKNKIEIEIKGFEPGFIQLQFFDTRGNSLRDDKRLLINGNEIIMVMFALQPGAYFLLLKQNEKILKKKLVVQ
jgi:hypothetical protein